MKKRALSIFRLDSYGNALRFEYMGAGLKIIRDFPLHGTGPDTVDMVFQDPKYGLSSEARRNVHLHNNIIQIAAERGIPALLAWLAFVGWAGASLAGLLKTRDPSVLPYAAAGTAALLAFFAAGLFEYNFGDSEVIVLLLYLITLPFAVRAGAKRPGRHDDPAARPAAPRRAPHLARGLRGLAGRHHRCASIRRGSHPLRTAARQGRRMRSWAFITCIRNFPTAAPPPMRSRRPPRAGSSTSSSWPTTAIPTGNRSTARAGKRAS